MELYLLWGEWIWHQVDLQLLLETLPIPKSVQILYIRIHLYLWSVSDSWICQSVLTMDTTINLLDVASSHDHL